MEQREIIVATEDNFREIVEQEIKKYGNNADLNHIDVSKIRVMSYLFKNSKFNGDISKWDVSNVVNMVKMFIGSQFNGDISNWDTTKVEVSNDMFEDSAYKGDSISNSFQKKTLQNIYYSASLAPVFQVNSKYNFEKFSDKTPYISYDDIMNNKYIIRGREKGILNQYHSEKEEIIAEYKSVDELVNDGWSLAK